jgi:hypothetical protein
MDNYLVQPELYGERKANYKTGESLNKVFTPVTGNEAYAELEKKVKTNSPFGLGFCGNIEHEILYNLKTKKVELKGEDGYSACYDENPTHACGWAVISSALAMYRLICMFSNPIVETDGANGYKVPWTITLKHKSGVFIQFREWKGGFGFGMVQHSFDELPKSFQKDLFRVLNLIFSDRAPHPYDRVTAGGVA